MSIARIIVAFAVCTLLGARLAAEPPTAAGRPVSRPAEFDALAEQLGSPDAKTRDAAQAKIVKLGDAAVKPVEKLAAKAEDAEVKLRGGAILRQIAAGAFKPTLVTLKFNKARAADVYAELLKQANAQFETEPGLFDQGARPGAEAIPRVTIDVKDVPFWTAFLRLEKRTGVALQQFGGRVELTDGWDGAGGGLRVETFVSGPFLVVADHSFRRAIRTLTVYSDPRIRVLSHATYPTIIEALDADGAPIGAGPAIPARDRDRMESPPFGVNGFDVDLMQPVPRLGWVRGTVRAVLAVDEQVVEIPDIMKANNVERIVDGRRFLPLVMLGAVGNWSLTLTVEKVAPNVVGWEKTRIELLDAKDNPLTMRNQSETGDDQSIVFKRSFTQGPNVGPPAKLRLTFPTNAREVDIPFEFGETPKAAGEAAGVAE